MQGETRVLCSVSAPLLGANRRKGQPRGSLQVVSGPSQPILPRAGQARPLGCPSQGQVLFMSSAPPYPGHSLLLPRHHCVSLQAGGDTGSTFTALWTRVPYRACWAEGRGRGRGPGQACLGRVPSGPGPDSARVRWASWACCLNPGRQPHRNCCPSVGPRRQQKLGKRNMTLAFGIQQAWVHILAIAYSLCGLEQTAELTERG